MASFIDIFDLWNDFASRVNTFQGGSFDFSTDFVRNVNAIYFDIWDRETRNARKSQESKDNVIAFLQAQNILIPASVFNRYAVLPLPTNYGRFSSARIVLQTTSTVTQTIPDSNVNNGVCMNGKPKIIISSNQSQTTNSISEISIELIEDNQWAGCLQHRTKKPTLSNPKMSQINGSFQIAPKGISVVVFSYYVMPTPAFANVTYTAGDNQSGQGDEVIYNANGSTQILLPLNLKNEFLWKLGTIYGYFTREQFLALLGNEKEKEVK